MGKQSASRLILIRHGESEGNRERRFTTTPVELPLTELGRQQAAAAAAKIAELFGPELVVTSHYLRAHHTGRIIAEQLDLPIAIEQDLHERDMGDLKGQPYEVAIQDRAFDSARPWLWKPAGGESLEDVRRRTGPVLDRLARAHAGRDLVIVSHGGVMFSLWAHVTDSWEGAVIPPNCGIIVVEHVAGRYAQPKLIAD